MILPAFEKYGIQLQPMAFEYLELVRSWRNHPEVARYMFSEDYIAASDQMRWFEGLQVREDTAHWVFHFREQPLGVAYLTAPHQTHLLHSTEAEAGFYLAPNRYRGTVMAFAPALALNTCAFETLAKDLLTARVKKDNTAARRFNLMLGYQMDTSVSEDSDVLVMYLRPKAHTEALKRLARFLHL